MTHILDELTLQRCVDGELSESEQQALLRQLERNPAGWRELALGFLEQQLWARAGRDWVQESPSPQVAPPHSVVSPSKMNWVRTTVLAASTLLAIGLGYLGGSQGVWSKLSGVHPNPTVAVAPVRDVRPRSDRPVETPELAVVQTGQRPHTPKMHMALISNGGNSEPISLPVYEVGDFPEIGDWMAPRLSEAERQHLQDQGYQIREEPLYYSVPMKNNRHLVVPINTVHVRQQIQ